MHEEELQRLNEALDRRVQTGHKSWPLSTNPCSLKSLSGCRPQISLEHSRQALQKLAFQLLRVQEEERRRISRDLHDDINQRLALLAMDIEAVGRQLIPHQVTGPSGPSDTRTGCGVVRCCSSFGLSASSFHSR